MTYDVLLHKVESYMHKERVEQVRGAYEFAYAAHDGQTRVSGQPYITHPVEVAIILAGLELDPETIMAALLHDVVEDTEVTYEEIEDRFGTEIAFLVDGVTKLKRLEEQGKTRRQAENLRKMLLAMARDIRVVLIKLADRLHNMRTLKYRRPEKQRDVARETLEIYAPLAHRLGIGHIQYELEDLALRYLEPERYFEISKRVAKKRSEREQIIQEVVSTLIDRLHKVGINAEIQGRPKHFYSIYRKMVHRGKDFSEIYDLTAIRVVVETVKDCYGALGVVHTLWKPIPGRFKDYIAMPKPNMYQSLHTTVIGIKGEPVEIQIRTYEMHQTAELGIAAHWKYKEGASKNHVFDEKLVWLRQVLEWQQELRDPEEFMNSLKIDLFADQVFVFSPKGDVIELPSGATSIDFAYRIHTEVGHSCVGAKVNGRIVPLDYRLRNGDIVEILTTKVANGPSRDWLKIAKTSSAKSRIRQWFKREQREENIERGEELLRREIRKLEYEPSSIIENDHDIVGELMEELNYVGYDDLLAAIGFGTVSAARMARKLVKAYKEEFEPEKALTEIVGRQVEVDVGPVTGFSISGVDNALVNLAKCCNPVPGDDIIGYITRGRGVTIHRTDCPNIRARANEAERLIDVSWEDDSDKRFPARVQVSAQDRPGVLHDIIAIFSEKRLNMLSIHAVADPIKQTVTVYTTSEVRNAKELEQIIARVTAMPEVYSVTRV